MIVAVGILAFAVAILVTVVLLQNKRLSEAKLTASHNKEVEDAKATALDAQLKMLESRFSSLAAEQLLDKQKQLADANTTGIKGLFDDLKSKMDEYKKSSEAIKDQTTQSATRMDENVKKLQEFATEAQRFTAALTSSNKVQGNTGEHILASILEASGFKKGEQYNSQFGSKEDSGRPDVVVYDALNKHIMYIDSKMNIKDYIDACNMPESPEGKKAKAESLKKHAASIKKQIDGLSARDYAKNITPDRDGYVNLPLVAMFCPFNSVLEAALNEDSTLMEYAFKRNIVLVTPTTLWGFFWLVSYNWRRHNITHQMEDMQRIGGEIIEKVEDLFKDIDDMGKSLDGAKKSYDSLLKRAGEKGQPSIRRKANELLKCGGSTTKQLKHLNLEELNKADAED